tara:strand:+ start:548 stop:724 length:177 start_codon:yes stop_codon:yes gene_type:complete
MGTLNKKSNYNYYMLKNFTMLLIGGAKRDRTADLLHAMQALSQLSYSPRLLSLARRIL